jgi:hypothetical protein
MGCGMADFVLVGIVYTMTIIPGLFPPYAAAPCLYARFFARYLNPHFAYDNFALAEIYIMLLIAVRGKMWLVRIPLCNSAIDAISQYFVLY